MGQCLGGGLTPEQIEENKRNKLLNQRMQQDQAYENGKVKLLLLGAGESGKSTLFKQMKILYGANKGFDEQEVTNMRPVVFNNIIVNMKTLVEACNVHVPVADGSLAKEVLALDNSAVIDQRLGDMLSMMWKDSGVQATWLQRGDIQVQDALEYYMGRIEHISQEGYRPSDDDILRSRVRTSGIVEEEFNMDKVQLVMFDVGGQRNERKKWIHAFEDVAAVIFVAAISEYDQFLYEDNSVNRQVEAIELFESVCNERWFRNSGMILFLNKADLFREKLPRISFRIASGKDKRNVDFAGPYVTAQSSEDEIEEGFDAACKYLEEVYKKQNHYPSQKHVYVYVTTATNTKNMGNVMTACKDIFLKVNLRENGFM